MESVIQCVYMSPANLFHAKKMKLAAFLVPQHGLAARTVVFKHTEVPVG